MANLKAIKAHEKIMELAEALEDCGIAVCVVEDNIDDAETMISFDVFDPSGEGEQTITVAAMAIDDYEITHCVEPL